MEIEAKFAIPDADIFFCLQTIDRLANYTLLTPQANPVRDTYFDTRDRRILAAGYACRLRQTGAGVWVTLKGLGRAEGAVHRREELEMPLPALLPFSEWPAGQVHDRVSGWIGDAPLAPLFTLQQSRMVRRLEEGDRSVAEWSLDEVRLTVGEREQVYFELEIELEPGGTEDDLEIVVACLQDEWGLRPEPRSKFERAMRFVEKEKLPRRPGLSADDTMAKAARKTFALHFRRMLFHEPGTRLGQDIEALHDMRVATRRMRAAFEVFGDFVNLEALAPLPKGLRRTGRQLGTVRDLDVFWEKVQHYLDTLPGERRDDLQLLRKVWQAEREKARREMLAYLDGDGYARFKARFSSLLQTPEAWPLPGLTEKGEAVPRHLRHVVPMVVYQRLAEVLAYDEWVTRADMPLERLHRLRIAAKRLRYTFEFFEEVLAPPVRELIEEIKNLQDHLGDLQDAVVAIELLRDFLNWGSWGHTGREGAVDSPVERLPSSGVSAFLAFKEAELGRLLDTFPPMWAYFQSHPFKQAVAAAVASL